MLVRRSTGLLGLVVAVFHLLSAPADAKRGKDEIKSEVGPEQDDRGRHGRNNGESGRATESTSGSGRSGHREGYDRPNGNGSGAGISGSGSSGSSSGSSGSSGGDGSGSAVVSRQRDELDRF